ncbi:Bug family tripartite tricarboxylate transporter substrate binding protein [Tardiphaga sp. 866_E4_N2_1]|uniref:Bug family tripartite tricarboxylate transporter substrate binding protein n=1 Tax=unclassified Tardiphaga TaxID=2631404 RepID=UPI003F27076F
MRILIAFVALLCSVADASAQAWPTKVVQVIVPLPAGSAADIAGRAIAEKLSQQLGQRFVVDNRPGASGSIGLAAVARANPDGYTITVASSSWSVIPATMTNLSFDPLADLAGVTIIAKIPNMLVMRSDAKIESVGELIAAAKARPGKFSYATVGLGSASHLNAARFQLAAGIDTVAVPYKGSAQALTDLIGGSVDYCFCPVSTVLPFVKEGKLVALAAGSAQRSSALPNVPTTEEAGVPNSAYEFWVGIGVRRGTPRDIVDRLHGEIVKALNTPDIKTLWASLGQDFQIIEPEKFDEYLRGEATSNASLVKAANISVN